MTVANIVAEVAVPNTSTLVSNTFQQANTTANGATYLVRVAGQALPGVFGSENIYPSAVIQLWAGAASSNIGAPNANAVMLVQATVPPQQVQNTGGTFSVSMVATLRANGAGVGANANQTWTAAVTSPDLAVTVGGIGANGAVVTPNIGNVSWNLSVVAVASSGQPANLLVDLCTLQGPLA